MSLKLKIGKRLKNFLIALDQLANTIAAGHPDETFSSRVYRKSKNGHWLWKFARVMIDAAFFWQNDHCRAAYESERLRKHLPVELRAEI